MERDYHVNSDRTVIYYGETFAAFLKKQHFNGEHFIFITNQIYYDRYADKIGYLLPDNSEQDWFITPNHRFCNNLDELDELIAFSSHFSDEAEYVIAAFGNEGVIELAAFFSNITCLNNRLWILPVSLMSLTKGVLSEKQVVQLPENKKILAVDHYAEYILIDDTLRTNSLSIAMMDLFLMIRCGIVCDVDLLKTLFKNYQQVAHLKQTSFTGLLDSVLTDYEKNGNNINGYGEVFEAAFYQVANGHLLSADLKTFFGFLFALIWNIQKNTLDFHLENFLKWLAHLGYPLELPSQILIGDYGAAVLDSAKRRTVPTLKKIGVVGEVQVIEETDLVETFKLYEDTLQRMRGN